MLSHTHSLLQNQSCTAGDLVGLEFHRNMGADNLGHIEMLARLRSDAENFEHTPLRVGTWSNLLDDLQNIF